MDKKVFIDSHSREVRYLRVSVTDRCNLSCMYCVDENVYIPHDSILRFEEIMRCVRISVAHGVDKIRLTGGEPFVRKGFVEFLSELREEFPLLDIRVTTNGTSLMPHIQMLKDADIKVNLSLDSFSEEKFKEITGKDLFSKVHESLYALIDANIPLKINAVAMKGVNDNELESFVNLAKNNPVDVRFIEFMPMGDETIWKQSLYWSSKDIISQASEFVTLTPVRNSANDVAEGSTEWSSQGPAKMFTIENGKGRFGVISPMSSHFCHSCNRLRITSDGKLRTCLFDDNEFDLVEQLRNPAIDDEALAKFIADATMKKEIGAELLAKRNKAVASKRMVTIGG